MRINEMIQSHISFQARFFSCIFDAANTIFVFVQTYGLISFAYSLFTSSMPRLQEGRLSAKSIFSSLCQTGAYHTAMLDLGKSVLPLY
jgi:hypothetical protein